MQQYPKIITEQNAVETLRIISRLREEDITDRNNFNSIYFLARKVGKIPTSSADVDPTDRIGDINFDADYLYVCVNDTGAAWRRTALATW